MKQLAHAKLKQSFYFKIHLKIHFWVLAFVWKRSKHLKASTVTNLPFIIPLWTFLVCGSGKQTHYIDEAQNWGQRPGIWAHLCSQATEVWMEGGLASATGTAISTPPLTTVSRSQINMWEIACHVIKKQTNSSICFLNYGAKPRQIHIIVASL